MTVKSPLRRSCARLKAQRAAASASRREISGSMGGLNGLNWPDEDADLRRLALALRSMATGDEDDCRRSMTSPRDGDKYIEYEVLIQEAKLET